VITFASGPINRNGLPWRLRYDAQGAVIWDLLLSVCYHGDKRLVHGGLAAGVLQRIGSVVEGWRKREGVLRLAGNRVERVLQLTIKAA
jgi:hypothetical protein